MSKKTKKPRSRTIELDKEEFGKYISTELSAGVKALSLQILESMSIAPKVKRFFKGFKPELIECLNSEDDVLFSPELSLKIYEYTEKFQNVINGDKFFTPEYVDANHLRKGFLEKSKNDIQNENDQKYNILSQEELLKKIKDQEDLILKLKKEKIDLNERNQAANKSLKEAELLQNQNTSLKEQNISLKKENDNLKRLLEEKTLQFKKYDSSNSSKKVEKLNLEKAILENQLKEKDLIIENQNRTIEQIMRSLSDIQSIVAKSKNAKSEILKNSDNLAKPSRKSKVAKNSNRFILGDKKQRFTLPDRKTFVVVRNYNIRLYGWKNPRKIRIKRPKNNTTDCKNLISALTKDELFKIKNKNICIIREKNPVEMAEIIELFGEKSRYIQPYKEEYTINKFLRDVNMSKYDIFIIFKDSSKHFFNYSVLWENIDNAIVFDFDEEKIGEDRSKTGRQVNIIRRIISSL